MKIENDNLDRSPRMRQFMEQRPGALMRFGIPVVALIIVLLALVVWLFMPAR